MHAVALAARERADLLLLVGALEVERRAVAARIHFALAEQDDVLAAGNLLPHVLLAVETIARLVDVAEMHRLADLDRAGIGLVLPGDHPEQRGLAGAVGANHPDNATRRQLEGEVIDQQAVAEPLGQPLEIDHVLAKPLGDGNRDLRGLGLFFARLLQQVFVTLVARLGFGLAGLRRSRDPFLFPLQRALMRRLLAALLRQPLLLLR